MPTTLLPSWLRAAPARFTLRLPACLGWIALYVLGSLDLGLLTPDARALVWTAAVTASFAGWGAAVAFLWDRDAEIDWGLRAAWGMAATTLVGGPLVALGICTAPVLRAIVGLGVGLGCAVALRPAPPRPRLPFEAGTGFVVAIVSVLALLLSIGSLTDRGQWWAFDDTPAYLVFPVQLLHVGDLLQPFSFRRMSSFGTQSFFQAMVLAGADPEEVHLFDRALCSVVVLAMLLPRRGPRRSPYALRLLPALLVLLLPNYRMNIAAVLSGTVFFFALYRTLELPPSATQRPRAQPIVLGMLVASACALRPFFVLPAVGTVALAYVFGRERAAPWRALREPLALTAGTVLFILAPWSVALVRSNGTPIFPPFHGDYHPETGFTHMVLGYDRLKMIWEELRYWEPILTIHLFFISGLVAKKGDTAAYRASFLALLFGFLVMLAVMPISDYRDLVRYAYPMELAFVLVVVDRGLTAFGPKGEPAALGAGFLVLAACAGELYFRHEDSQRAYDDMMEQAYNVLGGRSLLAGGGHPPMYLRDNDVLETPMLSLHGDRTYADLQRAIPDGEPFISMVEEPYRFDFRRNRVEILDLPGVVAPEGGIPVFHGPEPVARYFLSLGRRYVAFADTRTCRELYSDKAWEEHTQSRLVGPQNFIAPWVLDVFANLERLGRSRRRLFDRSGMIVIDLSDPRG